MIKQERINTMYRDPYEILGVTKDASEEDIKRAYRELAKKYHPDNYTDPNMAALASEKMQEINEAYEYIKNKGPYNNSDNNNYTGNVYFEIRNLINMQNFPEADAKLESIPHNTRGAEWHFLKGCILTRRGWFLDAQKYFETAHRMEPQNPEYRQAAESLKNTANGYNNTWNNPNTQNNSSCSNCCAGLCRDILCCMSIDCCTDIFCGC